MSTLSSLVPLEVVPIVTSNDKVGSMMTTLLVLMALSVVAMTSSCANSDNKVGIVMTLRFQCLDGDTNNCSTIMTGTHHYPRLSTNNVVFENCYKVYYIVFRILLTVISKRNQTKYWISYHLCTWCCQIGPGTPWNKEWMGETCSRHRCTDQTGLIHMSWWLVVQSANAGQGMFPNIEIRVPIWGISDAMKNIICNCDGSAACVDLLHKSHNAPVP